MVVCVGCLWRRRGPFGLGSSFNWPFLLPSLEWETVERVDRVYQAEVALHICALECNECMPGEKRGGGVRGVSNYILVCNNDVVVARGRARIIVPQVLLIVGTGPQHTSRRND
eukprot:SAG11_NODE_1579_length_4652_cov_5.253459_5_plen_113_part_00